MATLGCDRQILHAWGSPTHTFPQPRMSAPVKTGKAQNEQMFSGLPPKANIQAVASVSEHTP